MTHFKLIEQKALHHPEFYLTTKLKLNVQKEDFNAEKACLSKYFPKYYRNLIIEIPAEDHSIETKLGQTKVIRNFTGGSDDYRSATNICDFEQRIFRNKRKSVKSLPLFFSPSERKSSGRSRRKKPSRPQFSTFFPKLTSLNLSSIEELKLDDMKSLYMSRELEQKIKLSYGYFWNTLQDLEHLEISNENDNFCFIIQEINSSSIFLSSLKTMKLSLASSQHAKYHSRTRDQLNQLAKNEHFLNRITHLNCQKFETLYHFDEVMSKILAQCPKLVSLNFLIGRESNYYPDVEGLFPEHEGTQVFQQLAKMNKLEALNVSVFGSNSFLQHFSVPPSVRKLILYVGKSINDISWLDLFLEPQYNFFERWKGLSNLHTIKLKIRVIENPNDLFSKFINPFFEALQDSCLKKLQLQFTEQDFYAYNDDVEQLDFSLFLRAENAGFKHLESVKLLAEGLKITFDPTKSYFLSGLKKFAIDGEFSKKFDSKSFLDDLFVAVSSKAQFQQRSLKLSTFKFKSIGAFDEFLKLAKKITRTENLSLDLKIDLFVDKDVKDFFNYFRQPIHMGENCTVDLTISFISEETQELSESDKKAFREIFNNFKLKVVDKSHYNKTVLEF